MFVLKDLLFVFVFVFGVMVGHVATRVEFEHNDCYDTTGKYQRYEAWLSVKDGIYRCFWIEREYPHRVKMQGVIDVK